MLATPRKAKVPESPGYCKADELAKRFGTTRQWIGELTRNGILKKQDTPAGKRYHIEESNMAYIQYLREKAAGREDKGIPKDKERDKFEAEVKLKQAKADIADLNAQELRGTLHRSEDVLALTEDLIYTIRDSLLALPGRLAVDVAAVDTAAEAAEIIRREVGIVMQQLSEYRYDPQKYEERVRKRMKWELESEDEEDESE